MFINIEKNPKPRLGDFTLFSLPSKRVTMIDYYESKHQ